MGQPDSVPLRSPLLRRVPETRVAAWRLIVTQRILSDHGNSDREWYGTVSAQRGTFLGCKHLPSSGLQYLSWRCVGLAPIQSSTRQQMPVPPTRTTLSKADRSFYYVTTAVDSSNVESVYSNQVTASIP